MLRSVKILPLVAKKDKCLAYLFENSLCQYVLPKLLVAVLVEIGNKFYQKIKHIMSKKNQHIVPNGKDWAVKGAGNDRKTAIVNTQAEAIRIAREIAINLKSEVVIHRPDGKIRDKDSYGNDPNPPIDKKY